MQYQRLLAGELPEGYEVSNGFFQYGDKEAYDWKIHISVAKDQVEAAHDAIVDVLKKNFSAYKVITPSYPKDQRHFNGAQFTLYLSEELENDVEKLKHILNEINTILVNNHIQAGIIPKSDALLVGGGFFSLRNDGTKSSDTDYLRHEYHYMPEYVGIHYNPTNANNPYKSLLKTPDQPFELISYLNGFEVNSIYGLHQALGWTCLAYLFDKYENEQQMMKSFETMKSDINKFDSQQCFALTLVAAFDGMPTETGMDTLKNLSLHDFYPYKDSLGEFLLYVDQIKKSLPLLTENAFSTYTHRPGRKSTLFFNDAKSTKKVLKEGAKVIRDVNIMKEESQSQFKQPQGKI